MQHRQANDWWTVCAALGFTGASDEAAVSRDPDTTGQQKQEFPLAGNTLLYFNQPLSTYLLSFSSHLVVSISDA